jgi:DNA-directed RNA polymerase subunit RPC12/RpoP
MTHQIKISASLQEAQLYIAECLEFVTQDEPFVLEFNGAQGAYVQAIRDSREQICVEISGTESIEGNLDPEVEAKLADLGWGMPRQPDAETPNFWREYPEDADFKHIAKDAILGVAVTFPEAKFVGGFVDSVMSMDEAIELVESGQRVFIQPQDAISEPRTKEEFHSAWQNYQAASFRCSKCKKSFPGESLENDFQGLVLTLRCPKCHRKLVHLSVEASNEEIEQFAAEGSPTAIEHLEIMAASQKETGTEKDSDRVV